MEVPSFRAFILSTFALLLFLPPLLAEEISGSRVADVRAYGAKLDGTTDDSAAFIAAANGLGASGTILISGPMAVGSAGWSGLHLKGKASLSIVGTGGARIIPLAIPSQSLTHYTTAVALKISDSFGVRVDGISFDGNGLNLTLLAFDNVTESSVVHNTFHGVASGPLVRPAVVSDGGARNRYAYNDFRGGWYQLTPGIGIPGGVEKESIVAFNSFRNAKGACFGSTMQYSTIVGNTFDNCDSGINLGGHTAITHDVAVVGNTVNGCSSSGSGYRTDSSGTPALQLYNMTYTGNTVDNCRTGFAIARMKDSAISGNSINRCDYGIGGDHINNLTITGNRIGGTSFRWGAGVILNGGTDNADASGNIIISGNVVSGYVNGSGIQDTTSSASPTVNVVYSNNLAVGNARGLYSDLNTDGVLIGGNVLLGNSVNDLQLDNTRSQHGMTNVYARSAVRMPLKQKIGAATMAYGTSAPTSGTWGRGDRVVNMAPSSGGPPGWVCVTGGSPGTWKAEASLAP